MRSLAFILLCATSLSAPIASAQSLNLRVAATGETNLKVAIGDTVEIEISARLGALPASGLAVYLSVPAQGLTWIAGDARPFETGDLFAGGIESANKVLPPDQSWGLPDDKALLNYAVVMGPGSEADRARSGTGVGAVLRAVCTAPIEAGRIAVFDNAIHQTRVVLADGRTELGATAPYVLQLSAAAAAPMAARNAHASWGRLKRLGLLD